VQGFLVFDHVDNFPQALKDLTQWASEGKIKSKETIAKGGIEQADQALRDVYRGVNTGQHTGPFISCPQPPKLTRHTGKFLLEVQSPSTQSTLIEKVPACTK
jgi:hypothetical protein